ncbi:DUF3667 domain-containing protein [Flavobacterium sp.]|uniref:DUF3667 domain-containing protein n=1 Tax=Flavobacterium sp. TaxID=239 RepID=UPI00352788AC
MSLKGTWEEFIGPFFSWDNNFWRTCIDLFKNPKDVLEAYISGARKKYFQPFSFLILYATIAVLFYKFFPYDIGEFQEGFNKGYQSTGGKNPAFDVKAFYENMFNYYNFIVIATVPFYALITYITFIKKGNNYSEHLVFNCYLHTIIGYFSMLLQLVFLNIFHLPNTMFYIQILFSIVYSIYVFKKLYALNTKQILISTLYFWLLAIAFFIFFSLIAGIFIFIKIALK